MIFNPEEGEMILETQDDLTQQLQKHNCETEEELDDLLWYTYGISLINRIGKDGKE